MRSSDTSEAAIPTQLYDVRDLIAAYVKAARAAGDTRPLDIVHSEGVDHLKIMICGSVDRASWLENSGSVGSISEFMGILAIAQSSAAQARVTELLEKLRATGAVIRRRVRWPMIGHTVK